MREPTTPTAAGPTRLRRWTTRAGLTALGAVVFLGWAAAMGLGMVRVAAEQSTLDPASVPYAQPGPQPVGLRDLTVPGDHPLPATVWYPATTSATDRVTYRHTVGILSGTNPVTLATYPGKARRGAPADVTAGPYPLVVLSPGFALGPGASISGANAAALGDVINGINAVIAYVIVAVIVTIMLNLTAARLLTYLLRNPPIQNPERPDPISKSVLDSARLPEILDWIEPALRLHAGIIVALVAVAVVYWLLFRSTIGFEFRASGANPDADLRARCGAAGRAR